MFQQDKIEGRVLYRSHSNNQLGSHVEQTPHFLQAQAVSPNIHIAIVYCYALQWWIELCSTVVELPTGSEH